MSKGCRRMVSVLILWASTDSKTGVNISSRPIVRQYLRERGFFIVILAHVKSRLSSSFFAQVFSLPLSFSYGPIFSLFTHRAREGRKGVKLNGKIGLVT